MSPARGTSAKEDRTVKGQILETWRSHDRVHLKSVEAIDDEGVRCTLSTRGVVPMLGYLIAYESRHRGAALLTLKRCGHPVPKVSATGSGL